MAKEQPHDEPKPDPVDGSKSESQQDTNDEDKSLNEETLQFNEDIATGETTLIPGENEHVDSPSESQDDPEKTIGGDDPTVRLDATVRPDATVRLDATVGEDVIEDTADKTVDGLAIDRTVPVDESRLDDGPADNPSNITVKAGRSDRTVRDSDASKSTAATIGTIMASANIGVTVNPRDLPAEDLEAWNFEVGEVPTSLPPAVDRTLPEQHLERLRRCDVNEVQSNPKESADYELVGKLGQGGMGDVYAARQGSLDRLLAMKVIKPLAGRRRAQLIRNGKLESVENERKQQFLSEAIVTSDLDHPNIVPIHDVALTSRGELFYSMKRVDGTPWSDVIRDKTRDENVEILLKTCDAVAFAHTRGVVHRDIKPENIMLGDFGVVMVMDWGLALPTSEYEKQDSIFRTSGLGGTPAFMAPELATGPLEKIGPAADIYLLGATLYMIITGKAPHHAKNVSACLLAVKTNAIRSVPEEQQGELLDIALKAMETDPADRYTDVPSFQQAIRDYRAHAESVSLAARAAEDLERGGRNRSYADLSRAAFRFEEAIKSWAGNQRAVEGLAETKQVHALAALDNGDFDLGLSLLDENDPEHQPIIGQLRDAYQERESRQSRLKVMRRAAAAMLAFIVVGGSAAIVVINNEKKAAVAARDSARVSRDNETDAKLAALAAADREETAKEAAVAAADREETAKEAALAAAEREATAKQKAIVAKDEAEQARDEEEKAKDAALKSAIAEREAKQAAVQSAKEEKAAKLEAEAARDDARIAQASAERERERAQYEQYVSNIGLAKARLERNEADGAREILESLRTAPEFQDQINRWEWRWLWHQANQSKSAQATPAPISDLAISESDSFAVVTLTDGSVQRLTMSPVAELTEPESFAAGALSDQVATSVAINPNDQSVAIGTESGDVVILDSMGSQIRTMALHNDRVNDIQFSEDGLLITGSSDRTVRVWDLQNARELTADRAHHISAVQQIAVAGDRQQLRVAVAISDNSAGQVAVWEISTNQEDDPKFPSEMTWNRIGTMTSHREPVTTVAMTRDGQRIASGDLGGNVWLWNPANATVIDYEVRIRQAIENADTDLTDTKDLNLIPTVPLVDRSSDRPVEGRAMARRESAHQDVIRSLRFNADGSKLVTASDDYTVKLWDTTADRLEQTLKGHGGWVVGAEFLRGQNSAVISASNDGTVRSWLPGQYVGAAVVHRLSELPAARQTQAHRDEILSATFSGDARKVVTASHDHTARIMEINPENLAFRQPIRLQEEVLEEGTSYVAMSLGLDRRSERLFVGSADATIRIWDLRHGTQLHEARGTGLNASFAISNDGRFLLTGSSLPKAKALLWQLDPDGDSPPAIVHPLGKHIQAVTAFAISPDSKLMFTGDRGGLGIVWDRETGASVGEPVQNVLGDRINAASFSADGNQLLIAADDQQLTVIDVETRQTIQRLVHDGLVTQVAVASDGRHVMTVSEGDLGDRRFSAASLWDLRTGQRLSELDRTAESIVRDSDDSTSGQRITSARFDETSSTMIVSRSVGTESASSIKIFSFDATGDARIQSDQSTTAIPVRSFELPSVLGSAEAVMPVDANRLVTMNRNGGFLWDLKSQRLVTSFRSHAALTEACFSADDRFVVTASRSLKIWDAGTGRALAKLESQRPIQTVQFAPQTIGEHPYVLATGDMDGSVRLWHWDPEARKITLLRELTYQSRDSKVSTIRRVCFSPTADRLVAVGDAGLSLIWNTREVSEPVVLTNADVDFTCAAISDDGLVVAAGARDKKVRIWLLDDQPIAPPIELVGHADQINDVALLGDVASGLRVITASADDTVRIWDPRLDAEGDERSQGREILPLKKHNGDVTSVDVTRDGRLLMTSGRDGNVILWPADPAPANLFAPE